MACRLFGVTTWSCDDLCQLNYKNILKRRVFEIQTFYSKEHIWNSPHKRPMIQRAFTCHNVMNHVENIFCCVVSTHRGPGMQRMCSSQLKQTVYSFPDNKVHGANMGPIWDRPHVGPMNFAIWVTGRSWITPYNHQYVLTKLKQVGPCLPWGII